MRLPVFGVLATLAMLFLFSANSAQAMLIGVGLDWRTGVFAQEYWHKGEPHYLLVNLRDKDVEIRVYEFDSSWRLGQPLGKAAAGPWKVAAGKQAVVSAKALAGEKLWRFVIGGTEPIGVLSVGGDPGYRGDGYATSMGLNGSGGMVPGVYLVQKTLTFEPGATISCELHLPAKAGQLKFKRAPAKNDDAKRPQELIVKSATSETLPIKVDAKFLTIDAMAPKKPADNHVVQLTIELPDAKTPSLNMIDGWLARGTGGNGVTRALWIARP